MKNLNIDSIMLILLALSGLAIITGAVLKLQHLAFGDIIIKAGFLSSLFFSGLEIWRLRKKIADIQEDIQEDN